jgi:tetratricopeptide (TPR) repeat protein
MRTLVAAWLSIVLVGATAAQAQEMSREQALRSLFYAEPESRRAAASRLGDIGTMDDVATLVAALRDSDRDTRDQAEQALWEIWARSGDKEVDALYRTGVAQMSAGDLDQAIITFSRIIELKPDFAEGWNKRATAYFLVGELRKSLADCAEVMKRNPYHFGALAGYAQIYIRLENYDRALDYARRALEVNPNLQGIRQSIEVLEQLREQRRNRMI